MVLEQLANRRVLAAITGTVFEDLDHSYRQEPSEQSLARRLVYLDINENAAIDTGEPFSITDDSGSYSFVGLPDGQYHVRLYDGSTSQSQVTPVEATRNGVSVLVAGATSGATNGAQAAIVTSNGLTLGDYSDGTMQSVLISNSAVAVQELPNGSYLVVGGDGFSDSAWLVDPVQKSATPIDLLGDGSSTAWSNVAIDQNGHGLLLQQADDATLVRSIDASDVEAGIVINDFGAEFPVDAQVIASQTGNRSVVAWAGQWVGDTGTETGMQVSLWSNATGSPISYFPTNLTNTTTLLDYDDASGLVALRSVDGGVSVYDTNADFALLVSLPDVTGPIAIDGQRELIVAASVTESTLKLYDARDGVSLATLRVESEDIGTVESIEIQQSNSLVLWGDKGTTRVSLIKPASHHVTLVGGQDSDANSFGVYLQGENELPTFSTVPSYYTNEDESFFVPSTVGALTTATDADEDRIVILMMGAPTQGTGLVTVDGSVYYTPDANVYGVDALPVILHDGRGSSRVFAMPVDVSPVDDPPQVILQVDEIAENILPVTIVGPVVIVDPDEGDENELIVDDPRFEIQGDQLVFVGNGVINYEREPSIQFEIYDSNYNSLGVFTLQVVDGNDPIETIQPDKAEVKENMPGQPIAILYAYDEDGSDEQVFTVDDSRFVVDGVQLMLAPGVSLDYEAEPTVTLNVTVTDTKYDDSRTDPLVINVLDVVEAVSTVALSNQSVLELAPGAVVGDVIIDGNVMGDGYTATVDDARFEIVGSELKLVDDLWVNRSEQEEIQLTIEARDVSGTFEAVAETFVIVVTENSTPYHNHVLPFDVNGSGEVSPLDALLIINYINENGAGEIGAVDPRFNYDVNGDGIVSPLDILLVLNALDELRQTRSDTVGGEDANGEQILPSDRIADSTEADAEPRVPLDVPQESHRKSQAKMTPVAQYASDDSLRSKRDANALDGESELTAEQFADGVDASLESLLDEMS